MSKGTIALIAWLLLITITVVTVISGIVILSGLFAESNWVPEKAQELAFSDALWNTVMRAMDAGTVAGDTGSWVFKLTMFGVTLFGIFVVSILIGLLTSGIEAKLDELRKGRSFVVEQDHSVILGWSEQIFTIVSELVAANANRQSPCIVIMADKDKVEMEDEIRGKLGSLGNSRLVCRTGSPIDMSELEMVNPHDARSIVILPPDGAPDPDTHVIKTILALTNHPNRPESPYHIVAPIRDPKNLPVAQMVGKAEVELVLGEDLISRISVQTSRQSGLSVVYTELLDFGGDEIYFKEEPTLVGKTFYEILNAYESSAIMGLAKADGQILINPPMAHQMASGDQVIAISEDDDTVEVSGRIVLNIDETLIQQPISTESQPEKTLILGWNRRGVTIVRELDQYVTAGSQVMIIADVDEETAQLIEKQRQYLTKQTLQFQSGDITDRELLESLQPQNFDHIMTLSYADTLEVQEADAKTLVTLLHLRDMAEKQDHDYAIVSEMLDSRNRELAAVTQADDFIVSDNLISLMLSQLSENKSLGAVFADLFSADGSEIYLKPIEQYVTLEHDMNFHTLLKAAADRGEVAIGYRIQAQSRDAKQAFGVVVNPTKSATIRFAAGDKLIVLAED